MHSFIILFIKEKGSKNYFFYLCTRTGSYSLTYSMIRNIQTAFYFFLNNVLTKLEFFHQWGMANSD